MCLCVMLGMYRVMLYGVVSVGALCLHVVVWYNACAMCLWFAAMLCGLWFACTCCVCVCVLVCFMRLCELHRVVLYGVFVLVVLCLCVVVD